MVTLILTRREWGSVQMYEASINRTFCNGLAIFFRQSATRSAISQMTVAVAYQAILVIRAGSEPKTEVAKGTSRILYRSSM